jgi:hypothetical protein
MHHWEWVAPTCTGIVGVFVALVGWFGIRNARAVAADAQKHAEQLAQIQADLTLTLTRDGRRAVAYVEALTIAERAGYWTQTVRPIIQDAGYMPLPLPDTDDQAHAFAGLAAFGSARVVGAWEAWHVVVRTMINHDRMLTLYEKEKSSPDDRMARYLALPDLRASELQQRGQLADVIAAELGHRDKRIEP